MRISQVTYKANVPNPTDRFRHEHAEVVVELQDGDGATAEDAFECAREAVNRALGIDVTADDVADAERVLAAARRAGLR